MLFRHELALVEDDPGVARALDAFLSAAGFSVATFVDSEAFFAAWDRRRFDAIILDLGVVADDASGFYWRLRRLDIRAPIIVVTGLCAEVMSATMRGIRAVAVFRKPIDPVAFLSSVEFAVRT